MPTLPKGRRKPWMPPPVAFEHTSSPFYHTTMWRKCRESYFQRFPLCAKCKENGEIVQGNVVDHKKPIRLGGAELEEANLQTLCTSCHNRKSGQESKKK